MKKRIAVLGSTGSIGRQTLEVAATLSDRVEVVALAGGSNAELLRSQTEAFRPRFVSSAVKLETSLAPFDRCEIIGLSEMAILPEADLVVVATVGRAGLEPTLAAVKDGKSVAVANKEVLVMAGELVTSLAKGSGAHILPIDSEHSAIWQCLRGEEETGIEDSCSRISRLILTASGGPFVDLDQAALSSVDRDQALNHPNWKMGPKITIDSATLMNKGLEVIEARWLFDVPYHHIEVVLHRESIVHSLVEFVDGSVKAQLGMPDMRMPIQYALTYPTRASSPWPRLQLATLGHLSFGRLDEQRFPCLRLAREAALAGGTCPAALSAADEVAVEAFLAGEIRFSDIPAIIERVIDRHYNVPSPTLQDVLAVDDWARRCCRELLVGVT